MSAFRGTIAVALLAAGLATIPADTAAGRITVIGSACAASRGQFPGTILPLRLGTMEHTAERWYEATAPRGGVLTRWTVNIGFETAPFQMALSVAGKIGEPLKYYIAQQTEPKTLTSGVNVFETRMHIVEGETIALSTVGDALLPYCATKSKWDQVGMAVKGLGLNESGAFGPGLGTIMIPAAAELERDGDRDGYGDASQDACDRSAKSQDACPRVALDAFAVVREDALRVVASTSSRAPVQVEASVSGPGFEAPVALDSRRKPIEPGKPRRFDLRFTARLNRLLAELPRGRKAKVRATATATDVVGVETTDTVRLEIGRPR